jgi:hypothetical protein
LDHPKEYIEIPKEVIEIPKEYQETDVAALLSINNARDVFDRRGALIGFLWGMPELPISMPQTVIDNYEDVRYEDIQSISRVEKLVVKMEFDLESHVYHFLPDNPNNKAIIYHQGHHGDFIHGKEQIRRLLENGFAVVAFSMPLLGVNNQPTVEISTSARSFVTQANGRILFHSTSQSRW